MFVQARTQRTGIFRDAVRSRGQETIQAPCGQSRMVKPSRFLPVHTEKVLSAWSRVPPGSSGSLVAHSLLQQMDRVPCRLGLEVVQALPPITEALQSFLYSFLPPFTAHCLPLPTLGPDSRETEREVIARRRSVGKGRFPLRAFRLPRHH